MNLLPQSHVTHIDHLLTEIESSDGPLSPTLRYVSSLTLIFATFILGVAFSTRYLLTVNLIYR